MIILCAYTLRHGLAVRYQMGFVALLDYFACHVFAALVNLEDLNFDAFSGFSLRHNYCVAPDA